ncbi:translocation/assembly module TamB domain-containing protein [Mucilaginibacter sp. UR6-1]|uniref:translocation/assembly module TamB domain-containing protein n=1 Tax=Mucilaginibacter sp. UR6-1 TaxID=1435643 RepID=UPI001E3ABA20|nr:translocation/assembly module TamB domain-containing protein [Mucilaginibacter sp. UR6-1]MCC8411182.1 translocation/assembly module TamB domain-containing protein [Mucilaginibacter sp. UR6-1]
MVSILLLAFQYKPVQTWAAKKATAYLSKELNTKIDIKSLYIKPFSSVVLEGLYVLDKQKDTLLSTPKLTVEINGFSIFNSIKQRYIDFTSVQLDNGSFYLKKQRDSTTNLKFIIDYFSSGDTTKKASKPWTLNFERIGINNLRFRYKNQLNDSLVKGVNFDDVDVRAFSTVVRNLDLKNHLFKASVYKLTFKEKSGFYLKNLTAQTTVDTNQILLQQLFLQTPNSSLRDHFKMSFNSFDDFSDFERRVNMDADFKNAHLSSKDVAYFTSSLDKTQFELGVNGRIRGRVNNLRASNLLVTAGQSTYIKGNFRMKGLPDWENTFMDMDIEQIATNKKDLDYLVKRFTGSTRQMIPAIVGKFGNVNFSGNFSGLQNDFVAYGTFKTRLGRFDTDINLKIGKNGIPSYSGKLTTNQFALGTLIDNNTIGRTSFTAQVKGSGDELKNLNIAANAKLKTFQFKGYTYSNIAFNGTFKRKFIDGLLKINDRNIKLSLDGTIDMKPKLPVYDFTASVENAHLNKLNLMKDTITVSTTLDADFSGTNLDNISGNIFLANTRLVNPRTNYVVDSLYLAASGSGRQRLLEFQSDAANGSITGNYSLSTLPDYFKSIVKKYIPSLKTDIKPFKSQDFDFNFKLKDVDPLLAVFMPGLKIPDQGTLIGKFNSADQTATLTGYIKTIQYNKIILHDLIIDENTAAQYLNANISLSKVDLSDSLYVKDVNITNFLNRDSLNFNIKLSDKNATNQLDLYGLVEFGRDTTAKLKLLPSDVILDREQWKLEEQVRIRFLNGKTQISNFELSNGEQMVSIDGFISDKSEDKLNVIFKQFRMGTLNPLTKPSGIALRGALNGEVILSSILKSPGMDADLGIDTLVMNNTQVGNVKIISNLDNERKKAIVRLNILNRGLETMDIEGAYSLLKDDENALDFDINMNQTEAIIFTPFISNLVSDVKGTLSTSIKLTGSLQKPQLNGFITLNNTGMTVNYLKTPYTLNDRLEVENSVVKINKMVLKDNRKGQGVVNGSVDLNNISNPTLDIKIEATNLLALNTTFKDNHLYYGTAYGSGDFSFTGPIDNMKIDIKAATQTGTVFNIPLNASSTASDYDFIRFVSHSDTTKKEAEDISKKFNGVTLNFDLTADEGTTVKIVTDYGKLEGNGVTRNLKLNINSLGDFEMFGDFLISSGKFEFTAKNFISKNFQVNQGGTIRWTGDPANAEINLNAIYEVRTNIAPLYTAAGFTSPRGNQQVLVQAQLLLTKSLLLPTIDFDFTFPTEPTIKEDVATYLSDNTNRSQQALSIIVRRNFTAGTGGGNLNEQVLSTASDAVSEFAFNQLNSFISQSNIKNIDINIRSFNEASASIRLFSDRLILNGSLFTNTGSNNLFYNNTNLFNANFSNLTKDFEALYRIRKDGNLTARYSYRVLSGTALSTFNPLDVQYVNGIGLVYQRDFDSVGEFLRNIFRRGRRSIPATTPAPVNPTPAPVINYKLRDDED